MSRSRRPRTTRNLDDIAGGEPSELLPAARRSEALKPSAAKTTTWSAILPHLERQLSQSQDHPMSTAAAERAQKESWEREIATRREAN